VGLQNRWCVSLPLLVCGLVLMVSCRARALPAYLDAAKVAYSFKPGGSLDKKSCNLCHAGSTNRNSLNFYGKDLQAALESAANRNDIAALLHSIDAKDSDGDGWPNADELKDDTLPGDPASRPNGPPPGSLKPKEPATAAAESNPFSLQAVFYPAHAQHPIIIHFPIALFMFSLFMDLFGIMTGNRALNKAAYFNLVAAAVTGVISVITGLLAWRFAFGGEPLTSDRWLMFHLILGVVTTVLLCVLWAIRVKHPADPGRPISNLYIVLGILTVAVISLTGHLGGIVSGIVK
jgi:uncharacterized membrane protein